MSAIISSRFGHLFLVFSLKFLLTACGGSSSNDSPSVSRASPTPSPTPNVALGFSSRPGNTSCLAGDPPGQVLSLERIYSNIQFYAPLEMLQVPGTSNESFYIAEKGGRVLALPKDSDATNAEATLALQLDVYTEGEAGIASMAFHPRYAENGLVYITYVASVSPGPLELRLSMFERASDGIRFENEQILMRIHEDNDIHFGGALAFGPNGYLYMSVGDDGDNSAEDPHPMLAQDPSNVYGSILRLDVDSVPGQYSIPEDNPDFTGEGPGEVWAYGFRNPWRMSFDNSAPHQLWSTNVGASSREEVNLIQAGGNYGWPICEGECQPENTELLDPIFSYRNLAGAASIGGFVYRGENIPELYGKYIFGDYVTQEIFALDPTLEQDDPLFVTTIRNTSFGFADFAQDNDGELYVVGTTNGAIYRLIRNTEAGSNPPPETLSETGCFSSLAGGLPEPADGVISYDVAQSFWSDGASKNRLLAIPDNTTMQVNSAGQWLLPANSVTIKHFYWQDQIFETRFFVRYSDGSYGGFTYEWNDDLSDAMLVERTGKEKDLGGKHWQYPSRGNCLRCHSERSGFHLSLFSQQLNIEKHYAATQTDANQLDTLVHNGFFNQQDISRPSAFPSREALSDDAISLDERIASYLHVNCANCHNGGSSAGRSAWDARFETLLEERDICDRKPFELVNSGQSPHEKIVLPGEHDLSTLWLRSSQRDTPYAMPPLGSLQVDEIGTGLMEEWINQLAQCPPVGTTIPARIQGQDYDSFFDLDVGNNGGSGQCDNQDDVDLAPVNDISGECLVGWTQPEEWLQYEIHVDQTRDFDLLLRLASGIPLEFPTRHLSVFIDGEEIGEPILVPSNDWIFSNYYLRDIPIEQGNHVVRIVFNNGYINLNYLEFQ